jgi:phosphoesterase RecJ-like protein
MADSGQPALASGRGLTDAEIFAERLRGAASISAFCHEQPDGDTLGAAVAIALVGARLGKATEVVSVDGVPPAYRFLAGAAGIRRQPGLEPDLAVICDAATLARVGSVLETSADWFARATIVNIDHHVTNTHFGALNIVDRDAAATCQVVADLLPVIGVDLDQEIATAILTGLVRDSHGFSTTSTTARTLEAAASAVAAGAPIEAISRAALHELPMATMRLWARLLVDLRTAFDDRLVYTVLTPDLLVDTGTEQHDADGVVEFLARGQSARITILFRELGGSTRVSLRTGPGIDAAEIAGRFAGGGHLRRSGCSIAAPAERAVELVLEACRPYFEAEPGPLR